MSTIVIKPKSKAEEALLTKMLKKMNVDAQLVREPFPNYKTITAIQEVEYGKGTKVRDSNDLFNKLIYFKNRTTPLRSVR